MSENTIKEFEVLNVSEHRDHANIFMLAFRHFPVGMLILTTGIACIGSPWLYHFFRQNEDLAPILQILLTAAVIGIVPFLLLYGITLMRLPTIRRNMQLIAEITFEESSWDRADLVAEENGKSATTFVKIEEKITIELYETD
jgi:hypothetical protein